MRFTRFGALAVAAVMAVGACTQAGAPSASTGASGATGGKTLKLGVSLPLSGAAAADGMPALRGVQLAVAQANENGGIGGYTIELVQLDHAVNGKYNEQQGASDMQTFVADPAVFGVV